MIIGLLGNTELNKEFVNYVVQEKKFLSYGMDDCINILCELLDVEKKKIRLVLEKNIDKDIFYNVLRKKMLQNKEKNIVISGICQQRDVDFLISFPKILFLKDVEFQETMKCTKPIYFIRMEADKQVFYQKINDIIEKIIF